MSCIFKCTGEKVRAGLSQLDRLLVQFARAAARAWNEAVPHGLHTLLAVWVQEDDDGIPLGVVQSVHSFWGHIQQSVTVLTRRGIVVDFIQSNGFSTKLHFSAVQYLLNDLSDGVQSHHSGGFLTSCILRLSF